MQKLNRLTDLTVKTTSEPGKLHDGGGLYLVVTRGRTGINKSWTLRYTVGNSQQRYCGLGAYPLTTLRDARRKAQDARRLLDEGIDPIQHKAAVRARLRQQEPSKSTSFRDAAAAYIASHESGWRGPWSSRRWTRSLETHVHPHIGDKSVADITVEDVLAVLTPLWGTKAETATQVRSRIELVLDWAKARGLRSAENCARWRGHLSHLLPKRSKVARVKHFNALPYQQMPAFVAELRERDEIAARCLRFVILTACRSAEAVMATWDEFDLEARVWTVPAERTKANRVHRIPLTDAAIALLAPGTGYVFTGPRGSHIAMAAMRQLLQRMGRGDVTPHGMRSAFRDWAGNETHFPRELAEAALSHVVGDQAEQAYRRGDALERRRQLMQHWADYCNRPSAEVIALRA